MVHAAANLQAGEDLLIAWQSRADDDFSLLFALRGHVDRAEQSRAAILRFRYR